MKELVVTYRLEIIEVSTPEQNSEIICRNDKTSKHFVYVLELKFLLRIGILWMEWSHHND